YAVADDEREGHQHYQQPEIVERDGQADQTQEHAEVNGVAREAVRPALDDGGGRQVGGDVRTGPGDSNDGPGDQRQREDKHRRAEQACRRYGRRKGQGHEPVERKPAPREPAGRSTGRNGKGTSQLSASPTMTANPHPSGGRIMT